MPSQNVPPFGIRLRNCTHRKSSESMGRDYPFSLRKSLIIMKIYQKGVFTRERAINRNNHFLPKRFIHMPGQPLFIKYFLLSASL